MIEASKLLKADEKEVKSRIARLYEKAAAELAEEAESAKKGGLTEIFKRQLSQSMRKKMHRLWGEVHDTTKEKMYKAANRAAEIHTSSLIGALSPANITLIPKIKGVFAAVPHVAVQNVLSGGIYGGQAPMLSTRIWRNDALQSGKIEEVIAMGIAKKLSPVQLAKDLEAYINPKSVMPDYWNDIYPDLPFILKTDYNAKRLAVTSIRHAAYGATIHAARENPFTPYIHWELTEMHVIYDVCDGYAEHDEGLGVGNYAPDNVPIPHPWCTCLWYADSDMSLQEVGEKIGAWLEDEEKKFKAQYGVGLAEFGEMLRDDKKRLVIRKLLYNEVINTLKEKALDPKTPVVKFVANINDDVMENVIKQYLPDSSDRDVVITDERKQHIATRRGDLFLQKYEKYFSAAVSEPDSILKGEAGELLFVYNLAEDECLVLPIVLRRPEHSEKRRHSIITAIKCGKKTMDRLGKKERLYIKIKY